MSQWQVRATSDRDAVMTFGLRADDHGQAMITALERLPWHPKAITVHPVPERDNRERAL